MTAVESGWVPSVVNRLVNRLAPFIHPTSRVSLKQLGLGMNVVVRGTGGVASMVGLETLIVVDSMAVIAGAES